jgi:hypothetical protein
MKDKVLIIATGWAKDQKTAEACNRAVVKALEAWLQALEKAEEKEAKTKEAKEG